MVRNGQKTQLGGGGWGQLPIDDDSIISSLKSLWFQSCSFPTHISLK